MCKVIQIHKTLNIKKPYGKIKENMMVFTIVPVDYGSELYYFSFSIYI